MLHGTLSDLFQAINMISCAPSTWQIAGDKHMSTHEWVPMLDLEEHMKSLQVPHTLLGVTHQLIHITLAHQK